MRDAITMISSMATRALLGELVRAYEARTGRGVLLESVGGVDVEKRVGSGERFDVVVLARRAIDELIAAGRLAAGSVLDVVCSGVGIAVRAGTPRPEIGSEAALLCTVLAARTIGYSTGPSGVKLAALFERWGIMEAVSDRIVIAPVGVPVGLLVARGDVELGFQQLSELANIRGIDVLGPLPAEIQIVTTFSAAVGAASRQPESARLLIDFLASPAAADEKRRHGMEPAPRRAERPEVATP